MHITIHMNRMDGPDPPYDHNFLLGSAVYTMLREASGDAATAVHDSPYRSAYVLSEVYRVRGRPKEAWFRMGTSSGALLRLAGKALSPGTDIQIGPTLFRVTGM